jgi:hypothetical protein
MEMKECPAMPLARISAGNADEAKNAQEAGAVTPDKGQWKKLSFEQIMDDTRGVFLGTLGDKAHDAGQGWQKTTMNVQQTLYMLRSGAQSVPVYFLSEDIPGKSVGHAPGKSGIWFLQREGTRFTANHPQRYLAVSEKAVVVQQLKTWIAAKIKARMGAIPGSVRSGKVFETDASRKAFKQLLLDIDAERRMEWKKGKNPWSGGENPYEDRIQAVYTALGIDLGFPLAPKNETEYRQVLEIVLKHPAGPRKPPEKGSEHEKKVMQVAPFLLTMSCQSMLERMCEEPKEFERIKKGLLSSPSGRNATVRTRLDLLKLAAKMTCDGTMPRK